MESIYQVRSAGGRFKPAFWKLVRAVAKKRDAQEVDADDCPDDQEDVIVQLGVAQGGIDVDVGYSAHAIAACGYSVLLKVDQVAPFLRRNAAEVFRTGKF